MNKSRAKSIGVFLLKLLGTAVFLWWALSLVEDKQSLVDHLKLALQSPKWMFIGLALAGMSVVAGALRWQILLRAQQIHAPFGFIFRLTLYGALFNIASIGGAAGDAAKVLFLIRRYPDKKVPITISVMVDHLVGFIATGFIFLIFAWGFNTVDLAKDAGGRHAFTAATWFQAGGILGIVLSFFSCAPGVMKFGKRYFPRLIENKWVQSISSAMDAFRARWHFAAMALVVSLFLAASYFLTFYAGLRALNQDVGASTILSVMPIVDVVSSLPISISGLGVRERTFEFLMSQLSGISTSAAVSASLLGFLFHVFWGLIGGVAFLAKGHYKGAPSQHELD